MTTQTPATDSHRAALSVLLPGENHEAFAALVDSLVATHTPANPAQYACLQRIAAAEWRYTRALVQESFALELAMREAEREARDQFGDAGAQSTSIVTSLAERNSLNSSGALESIRRNQSRLRREVEGGYRLLALLQKQTHKK